MSEETVHSPKITLGSLSRKMKNRRNNYPLLAATSECYFGKFIELLHGGFSPIRFAMAHLKSCVEQYFELIMIFVIDNIDKMPKKEVVNVKRWLNIFNSLHPENKKRMMKPNDLTNISTGGNSSNHNVQLASSWTLGDKENVSEDTKNYSLNISGLRSRKSGLNERNETHLQSVNNEENRFANQTLKMKTSSSTNSLMPQKIITKAKETKQFESVVNSKSSNHDVKINSSPKNCSENKQFTEDSKNCLSFSPDTIGHEFASAKQSNSKTMSHSFSAKMQIQRPGMMENDFSCLRNFKSTI